MIRIAFSISLIMLVHNGPLLAQDQKFGEWRKSPDGRCYCVYLYKSKPSDAAFKKQYLIYHPKDPDWIYWVNPKSNPDNKSGADSYWARCPTKANPKFGKMIEQGKDIWSILPAGRRQAAFAKLNVNDFPEAEVMMPPVPGTTDGKRTIPCPPEAPTVAKTPVAPKDPIDLPN